MEELVATPAELEVHRLRGICQEQSQVIGDLKTQLEEKQVCESCELVESLQKQLDESGNLIHNLRGDNRNLNRHLIKAKLTARIDDFLFNKVREEFIEEVSMYQIRNSQLIAENDILRRQTENAHNPQETSD